MKMRSFRAMNFPIFDKTMKQYADQETKRVNAEEARAKAEAGRVDAEEDRVQAETGRVKAEEARVQAETGRVNAEKAECQRKAIASQQNRKDRSRRKKFWTRRMKL